MRPFKGIRVAQYSVRGGAAYAGRLLHQLGADVTRYELDAGSDSSSDAFTRQGDPSPAYAYFSAGMPGPIRLAAAAELVPAVRGADVLLIDELPREYHRYGIAKDGLAELARVVVAITPFGLSGPYTDYKGSELTTQSFGGVSVGVGHPSGSPLRFPFMQSAQQAGLIAAITVAGLYVDAGNDPEPRVVDVSESDVWATMHAGTSMIGFLFANRQRGRGGRHVLGLPWPHGLFRCSDGWIAIQSGKRSRYEAFLEMVGRADWIDSRPYGSRLEMQGRFEEIAAELAPWFEERTREQVAAECHARDIPAASVRTLREVLDDPHFRERGAVESVRAASGEEVLVPALPIKFRAAEVTG